MYFSQDCIIRVSAMNVDVITSYYITVVISLCSQNKLLKKPWFIKIHDYII